DNWWPKPPHQGPRPPRPRPKP
uniref:Azemiopsin n=2 Tax=Azemiops feae TaxID=8773 RepID=AON_AZEFE|nr:RecName: Full=Azemiopsin [Azemiops feae]